MKNVYINLSDYVIIKECYHKVLYVSFNLLPYDLVGRIYTYGRVRMKETKGKEMQRGEFVEFTACLQYHLSGQIFILFLGEQAPSSLESVSNSRSEVCV